ncbi:MAG: guanine-specific ribonuclease N1 and T1 [Rhodoferax sp.]|uniref:ribonuclease n=1 Tax=Rhodoferax sp. TaxID=50421 RepID=UPI001400E4F4|nr:ribonuclease [Rhodoferax sp.]NDP38704.1 guanine-specific ribonuclease N1 and T1 [Rhodoferax sp.]
MLRLKSAKLVLTSLFLVAVVTSAGVFAKAPALAESGTAITVAALPQQGIQTYNLIRQGGPFAHEKDGVVFGNRERLLPLHTRGYYREYTVATPNLRARGARRIVCGGAPKTPDACYYTADHYGSFRRIVP